MTGIGFHEAREMWVPKLIDILHEKSGETAIVFDDLPLRDITQPYPTELSKAINSPGGGFNLCVPPGPLYALIKRSNQLHYTYFYETDGTYVSRPVNYDTTEIKYGDRVLVFTWDDTGPTEKGYLYYDRFGLDRVEIPADCPRLTAVMPRAIQMFNERYAYRMLNSETLEQWQTRLQHVADLNVYRYERALELYASNTEELANVLEKKTTERDATSQNSGSDSTTYGRKDTFTGSVKNIDTPDSVINASDNYADALTKSDNSNTASGTDTLTHGLKNTIKDKVVETREPEGGFVPALNDSIDAYRDITADFVREFENNFMNVFWY